MGAGRSSGLDLNRRSDIVMHMVRTSGSHAQVTGPKLRAVATGLFARHGYAAVSMRQIAAGVGVQVGALYNYIPDKQSLLFELMRDHMVLLLDTHVDEEDASAVERLRAFVHFHIRFHHDRPDAVFIAYMELRNLTPENFAEIEALRKTYETRLERIIGAGCAEGVFRVADSKIATLALIAMLTGVTTWFRQKGRLTLDEIEAQYWDLVRGALGMPLDEEPAASQTGATGR
jgi:AcrR family transcriptional regulator